MNDNLPLVSVLFITYKRFELLKRSVEHFLKNTDYPNLEIIIADDGSGPAVQTKIRTLPADVFALAPENRGLGANNNNGLRHCTGKYILMIQDDCICYGPSDYLRNTIAVMEANPEVGIVNYYGSNHSIDDTRRLPGSREHCYPFSVPFVDGLKEHFFYTDQPHVMSRSALEYVGYYLESRDIEQSEEDYNHRWRDQGKFLTAMFPAYYNKLFIHEGAEQSFRTSRFRYKLDAALVPIATFSKQYCKPLYNAGRKSVRTVVSALERLGVVR